MYLQITTVCNMTCKHCCFSCGKNGRHMSVGTAKKALEMFEGDYVAIGGGEPTLHPHFWEIVGIALGQAEDVWLATNGSMTETALSLARLARKGVLGVDLSRDAWHDEIDLSVVNAFNDFPRPSYGREAQHDHRNIRTVSAERVIKMGRADWGKEGCVCKDYFVVPSGRIHQCGCRGSTVIGNVVEGVLDRNFTQCCYKHTGEEA